MLIYHYVYGGILRPFIYLFIWLVCSHRYMSSKVSQPYRKEGRKEMAGCREEGRKRKEGIEEYLIHVNI